MTAGEEVQTGPRPFGGDAKALRGQALRFRCRELVTAFGGKDEREEREERSFFLGSATGEPERTEQPRRARVSLRTEPSKGKRYGFVGGIKPLERRVKAVRFS
jgi:hypothetical protein